MQWWVTGYQLIAIMDDDPVVFPQELPLAIFLLSLVGFKYFKVGKYFCGRLLTKMARVIPLPVSMPLHHVALLFFPSRGGVYFSIPWIWSDLWLALTNAAEVTRCQFWVCTVRDLWCFCLSLGSLQPPWEQAQVILVKGTLKMRDRNELPQARSS